MMTIEIYLTAQEMQMIYHKHKKLLVTLGDGSIILVGKDTDIKRLID